MLKTMQPFYTDGRRFLHLTASQIDSYVEKGAMASFAGNTVTISVPGEPDYFAKVRIAGKRRAAGWVNKFNQRSNGG